jgi:integrase
MADTRYLKRRHQSWSLYLAVPRAVRAKIGKSAIVESLHTQSLQEAQQRRWARVQEWTQAFERAATGTPLTLAEIDAEAREAYRSTLEFMEKSAVLLFPSPEDAILSAEIAHKMLGEATDFALVMSDMEAVARRTGVTLEPGSDTWLLMGQALVKANLAALAGRLRALRGEPSDEPITFLGAKGIDPLTLRPVAVQPKPPAIRLRGQDGMNFSEAAALFLVERQRDPRARLTEAVRLQHQTIHRLFADYANDPPLAAVTRATAADFLAKVSGLNPRWGQQSGAREKTLEGLLAKSGDGAGLSNRSVKRYAVSLAMVWKYADRTGRFEGRNPFEGQSRPASSKGWQPYTIEELNRLFGNLPASRLNSWIPLIALFSGMRVNEICQLRVEDVRQEAGVHFFDVWEGDGQTIKTQAGVRRVPIHSELMRVGFLAYRAELEEGQLFPALRPGGPDRKPSWNFSKRFTIYRRSVGVDRPGVSFHSFRKNVVTALDNAGVPQHDIAAVIGHERGFTLDTYSGGKGLATLKEIVERVTYPGLVIERG